MNPLVLYTLVNLLSSANILTGLYFINIIYLFTLQIVVNTVIYCFCVWLMTEVLRWVIGWAFFREKSKI